MTIKGIGTDIIEIDRIRKAVNRKKQAFLEKLFTKNEIAYCNKYKDPIPHFAARFAAKEAVVKAFGTGFGKLSFHDIEIINNEKGKPFVRLSPELSKKYKNHQIEISISHSDSYAIAYVVIF